MPRTVSPISGPRSLRVLVADDAARASVVTAGLQQAGWTIDSLQASTSEAFTEAVNSFAPEIVLSAPFPGDFDVFEALSILAGARPGCPLLVVTDSIDAQAAVAVVRAGAEDIVTLSDADRLACAVESALHVRHRLNLLSPRQRQVLALVARGNTSPEIATRLNISVKTVETHRGELMKRIGARDVVGLVHYALRVGLVPNAA
jgi:DNA-binding NarL/FixJ family response regulator